MRTRFGRFVIDPGTRQLLRDDAEIHLSPKAFDLLWTLIERRPKVIEKSELHSRIWPDTYVVDANLNVLVGEIRRAIGDTPNKPAFIRTVHGVGYAFSGVADEVLDAQAPRQSPLCWMVWKGQTFPLSEGDNVIGRDPHCSVWLDAPGVSRRHATVRLDGARRSIVLEDLGSTNGTFVRRTRVRSAVPLLDGDQVKVGTVQLTIRLWALETAPETRRIRRNSR